eukprot:8279118-Pyramimonas_sp.AAC.1
MGPRQAQRPPRQQDSLGEASRLPAAGQRPADSGGPTLQQPIGGWPARWQGRAGRGPVISLLRRPDSLVRGKQERPDITVLVLVEN